MAFLQTTARFRALQEIVLIFFYVFVCIDGSHNDGLQAKDFPGVHGWYLPVGSILVSFLLSTVAMGAAVQRFYKYGGKTWTKGGREQYAHAHGFIISFYVPLVIQVVFLIAYSHILHGGIEPGWNIAISCLGCSVLAWVMSFIGAELLFRRFRPPKQARPSEAISWK